MPRLARWMLASFATLPFFVAPTPVRAEDPPADKPEKPEKPEKKETNDEKPFDDWKICKQRGAKHNRDRAEFWTTKGAGGKDLLWVAKMWNRALEFGKAAEVYLAFLAWTPDAADTTGQAANQKNRPLALADLVEVYFRAKEYAKCLETAEKFRTDFPDAGGMSLFGWDIPGHAARMAGDEAKALELFEKAAETKFVGGVLDLVDVHLAAGRVDDAKAALAKWTAVLEKGGKELAWMKEVLDAVGTAQASLEGVRSIGTSEAPAAIDKPTLLYQWTMQTGNADRSLREIEIMRRGFGDALAAMGVATFKKYNPQTSKIEADMTEDQETEFYKRMISETFITPQPPHILVTQAWLDTLKMKWDRQVVILDKQGKLRYARLNQEKPWDYAAIELAAKALTK